ncbi:MAG TPA: competence/damage-inducible protein A [Phycisphaerae bacterium]|nr:competence/damage-inducible protein A [Phycisphaerae bacterium]
MHAEIISIGAELMTGSSIDTNSAWLSEQLTRLGVPTLRHATVGDDAAAIAAAMGESASRAALVLVTGGLGPTRDDLTRAGLAAALGVPLVHDPDSMAQIDAFFRALNRPMPQANRVQADVPAGATVLPNDWGTAPGIRACLGDATIFCMPGVPREMKAMFDRYVTPFVAESGPARGMATRVLRTFGAGESTLAEQIADLMTPGRNPAVGTTASEGVISVRIVASGATPTDAQQLADADEAEVRRRLGVLVYGHGDDTLASVVGGLLADRSLTLATAESCTGGLIAKFLTDVPGASHYLAGGVVTYSNALKTQLLGVPETLLAERGAVSAEVAETMAEQCRQRLGTDLALSVTGVAGPDGGTADKPVGLVYIALATPAGTQTKECHFSDRLDRAAIRDRTAKTALNLLRHHLLNSPST